MIHSAELVAGAGEVMTTLLAKLSPLVLFRSFTVAVSPLTATLAVIESPGRTGRVMGTSAAGTSSYTAETSSGLQSRAQCHPGGATNFVGQ